MNSHNGGKGNGCLDKESEEWFEYTWYRGIGKLDGVDGALVRPKDGCIGRLEAMPKSSRPRFFG